MSIDPLIGPVCGVPLASRPSWESTMSDLFQRYIKHIERYGTEQVYETAEGELDPHELGQLARRLRSIEPPSRWSKRWRLTKEQADRLLGQLDELGVSDKTIMKYLDMSRNTLKAARERL